MAMCHCSREASLKDWKFGAIHVFQKQENTQEVHKDAKSSLDDNHSNAPLIETNLRAKKIPFSQ